MAEFGEQLRKAREEKGMTQQTLAEKVYVTRQAVSRWESGTRYPDLLTLKQLCAVLEVSTDTLLSDERVTDIVEKTPVTETALTRNQVLNNVLIVFYTAIVLFYMIQAGTAAVYGKELWETILSGSGYPIFQAGKSLVEAGLFLCGFISIVKGKNTPKIAGGITAAYFILEAVSRLHSILYVDGLGSLIIVMSGVLPYAAGAIAAIYFFIKRRNSTWSRILVYLASIFGIVIQIYSLGSLLRYSVSYVTTHFVLTILLRVFIYSSFIYQAYTLENRRKKAAEAEEKVLL